MTCFLDCFEDAPLQPWLRVLVFFCWIPGGKSEAANSDLSAGSHYVQLRDIRLHFVVAGHGPYVFVISLGWGIGSAYLQNGLAPLKNRFTLIFLDERGSGESSRPSDALTMSTAMMADDLEDLRRSLGLQSVDLLAHSHGGTIALDYAERYPDRVGKLALIDPEVMDDRAKEKTQAILAILKDDPRYKTAIESVLRAPAVVDDDSFCGNNECDSSALFLGSAVAGPCFHHDTEGHPLILLCSKPFESAKGCQRLASAASLRVYSCAYHGKLRPAVHCKCCLD